MEGQDTAQTAPSQTATKSEPEEKTCCHCSQKTGCIVIAVFSSVYSLILLIVGIITLSPSVEDYHSQLEKDNTIFNRMQGVSVTYAIVGVFGLVTSLSLLFGVIKSSPRFMFPWLISSWIITLVLVVVDIFLVVAVYDRNDISPTIGLVAKYGFFITTIFIVLKHYQKIQKGVRTANVAYEPVPVLPEHTEGRENRQCSL